jgi:hypothetical protein
MKPGIEYLVSCVILFTWVTSQLHAGHKTLWIVVGVVAGAVLIALIALISLLWWRMPVWFSSLLLITPPNLGNRCSRRTKPTEV